MKELLLGIDIGTSACKAAVFAPDGRLLARAGAGYPVHNPRPGWAEQEAGGWWRGACQAVRACLEQVPPQRIAGVGVAGQSWSCLPIDESGEPLALSPIWQDTRSRELCRQISGTALEQRFFRRSGNSFQPFYTTPKLLWIQRHRPELWQRARWFLQSNGWIVWKLTGKATQDRSQCYGIHCYDQADGHLDEALCRELGINPQQLPPVFPCHQVVGEVLPRAALETGLLPGTPVVAGGLDAACGTLGSGVFRPGEVQEQGGQAGGMSICMDAPAGDPRLILGPHVVLGRWLLQGGTVGGGAALRWVVDTTGARETEKATQVSSPFALADQLAGKVAPGSDGVIFLPYLMGERSPVWDPEARGVFFGLSFGTGRGQLYRAVMEGAAYALRHNLEVAERVHRVEGPLRSMGGASASPLWMQIKADITGRVMEKALRPEATAWGAAILAGIGTGLFRDIVDAMTQAPPRVAARYEPRPDLAAVYQEGYEIYRELYESTRGLMARSRRMADK